MSIAERALAKVSRSFKASPWYNREAFAELRREAQQSATRGVSDDVRLAEAVDWLKRAQDATPDRGVARGFSLAWNQYFKGKGWQPSYPETTGYIIPTFFDCAPVLGSDELRQRALEMAAWESEVQMPSGAVMGGTVDQQPTPAVFNTGQVILGWLRAFEESGVEAFRESAEKAARFLVSMQEPDGSWRKGNSQFARASSTTYNARVGWSLILCGSRLANQQFIDAGIRNLDYTLGQQQPNGWFANNCLSDPSAPLTHTIAYAMEGLLGGCDVLGERRYLQGVVLAADHLAIIVDRQGLLPGRLDASWRGTVAWSCLAGNAQLAAVFLRLYEITGEVRYQSVGNRLLDFVRSTQNCQSHDAGLRGGIKGSSPFDGGYGRFEVLNWATKFYIDALLLHRRLSDPHVGSALTA